MKARLIATVLLLEPMTLNQLLHTDWPWPESPIMRWADRNICERDSYLEDPYPWEELFPNKD